MSLTTQEPQTRNRKWSVNKRGVGTILGHFLLGGLATIAATQLFRVVEGRTDATGDLLYRTESLYLDPSLKKLLKRLEKYSKHSPHDYKGCIEAADKLLHLEHTLGRKKVEVEDEDVPRICQTYKMARGFLDSFKHSILLNKNNDVNPKEVPYFLQLVKFVIEALSSHVVAAMYLASLQ